MMLQQLKFKFKFLNWSSKLYQFLFSIINFGVFTLLDLLDFLLCFFFRFLDTFIESHTHPPSYSNCYCYCLGPDDDTNNTTTTGAQGQPQPMSETLYQRINVFRDFAIAIPKLLFNTNTQPLLFMNSSINHNNNNNKSPAQNSNIRWSDCNCQSCASCHAHHIGNNSNHFNNLHLVVMEQPFQATQQDCLGKPLENVIFLHGFLSSSSFWVESTFPYLSQTAKKNYRLFAVDLLGFGKSPKPWDCLYTLKDHVDMIDQSLINKFNLNSFHIVAHSMGCIIALALASKYLKFVKSITLVAAPYFPSPKAQASFTALNRLAGKRLWPPLLFGSAVMSWYEHVGRSICFIICRNHRRWEWVLQVLLRKRDLHFAIVDFTRHTHHSAWHTMHNVICGGAKQMDEFLEGVKKSKVLFAVIQGDKDEMTPLECAHNLKMKIPLADVQIISNADHNSVIFGREQEFTRDLEHIWHSSSRKD